jgi:hypothetical protein
MTMYVAKHSRREDPKTLTRKIDSPLADAVREEIIRLVNAETFTLGTLRAIERVAEHGRMMLIDANELRAAGALEALDNDEGVQMVDPLENFGAKAIRELIGGMQAATAKPTSLVETVRAIAEARKLGLDNIAAELEASLKQPAALAIEPPTDPDKLAALQGEI